MTPFSIANLHLRFVIFVSVFAILPYTMLIAQVPPAPFIEAQPTTAVIRIFLGLVATLSSALALVFAIALAMDSSRPYVWLLVAGMFGAILGCIALTDTTNPVFALVAIGSLLPALAFSPAADAPYGDPGVAA